jgi:hypothetical protein
MGKRKSVAATVMLEMVAAAKAVVRIDEDALSVMLARDAKNLGPSAIRLVDSHVG